MSLDERDAQEQEPIGLVDVQCEIFEIAKRLHPGMAQRVKNFAPEIARPDHERVSICVGETEGACRLVINILLSEEIKEQQEPYGTRQVTEIDTACLDDFEVDRVLNELRAEYREVIASSLIDHMLDEVTSFCEEDERLEHAPRAKADIERLASYIRNLE